MAEKVEVGIDAKGNVLQCAKGLNTADCGCGVGAKICGKCGAIPIEMKMVPANIDEKSMHGAHRMPDGSEMSDDEMPSKKRKKGMGTESGNGYMDEMVKKKKGIDMSIDEDDEEDDEEEEILDEEEGVTPLKSAKKVLPEDDEDDDEDDDDEDDDDEDIYSSEQDLDAARKRRLTSMGAKSAELGRNAYMCAIERKVYPGGAGVCDDCPGGCIAEKGMPGLLSVEGIAEKMFRGTVLDSGYSSDADMFVVDVQTKDGRSLEVFVDGTTAEVLGFHKLDDSAFEQKSALDSIMVIDLHEAAEIAIKSIQGDVIAVEPDIFEGFDAYAVEIEGLDGKSYDVFVSLDGEVLGYDKYEPEEAEAIEAEAAEIALKRAFSDDMRNQMAEAGKALPDGSYPIESVIDLKNAIAAHGRATDKEAAKRHIMKRAKALGQENMIPDNWLGGSGDKSGQLPEDIKSSLIELELLEAEFKNIDPSN